MIEIKNLSKRFEDKVVFDNFNLTIEDGDFVIVVGESGAGKTTLLNMIGGIEKADSGKILVDNQEITRNQSQYWGNTVGFLFQNFVLLENKTVRQNLEMVKKKNVSSVSIEEALEIVGMLSAIDKKVYKLSGGEQQRVALARLMVKKCNLILADEPTGSLDRKNKQIVIDIIKKLNQMGKTIIMVTHDDELVQEGKKVISL